jgi:hypothetical protein
VTSAGLCVAYGLLSIEFKDGTGSADCGAGCAISQREIDNEAEARGSSEVADRGGWYPPPKEVCAVRASFQWFLAELIQKNLISDLGRGCIQNSGYPLGFSHKNLKVVVYIRVGWRQGSQADQIHECMVVASATSGAGGSSSMGRAPSSDQAGSWLERDFDETKPTLLPLRTRLPEFLRDECPVVPFVRLWAVPADRHGRV